MTFSGPAADRMAIRELLECYADAASRIDKAQWLGCWAPGAVWAMRQGDVIGHDALSQAWDTIFANVDALAFFAMPGAIAVTGDTATARCHVREIVRRGSAVTKLSARYDDELVRRDGRWHFARRTYVMNIDEQGEMTFSAITHLASAPTRWDQVTHIRLTGPEPDTPLAKERWIALKTMAGADGVVPLDKALSRLRPVRNLKTGREASIRSDLRNWSNPADHGNNAKDKGWLELGYLTTK